MYHTAIHLVPTARPRNIPASSCHLRNPSRGLDPCTSPRATTSASLARDLSLSMTTQPNAARTNVIRKMSRIPVRLSTNSRPSSDISTPAMQPSSVDLVIRRAIRQTSRMATVPKTALENRQPNEFSPKSHSPMAIMYLPTSGCTTYSPQPVPLQAWKMFVCPAMMSALAFGTGCHSTPWCRMLHASLT